MKILILGGAGKMAEAIERDLLDSDLDMEGADVSEIVIADMNPEALKTRTAALQSPKVSSAVIDVTDHDALVRLMKGKDLVVNAALTPLTLRALKAALEAGVNIITLVDVVLPTVTAGGAPLDDIGLPTEAFLNQLDEDFSEAGLTAVMGLGAGPGISSITGGYFVDKLDSVESIYVYYAGTSLARTSNLFPFSPVGIMRIYTSEPVVVKDGKLIRVPRQSGKEAVLFPEPIGRCDVFSVLHEEPISFFRSFKHKGLRNAATKAGWGPELVSKLEFLDSLGLLDFEPRKVGDVEVVPVQVLVSGVTFEEVEPQDYSCMKLSIKGEKSGEKLEYVAEVLSHPYKGFAGWQGPTGISAAIGVRMFLRGDINRKGAFPPEVGVDPELFFAELAKRRIYLSYSIKYHV
ncbi:MAG: saccharopine dehydrogenase NADP-binding domain-containing protein [Deltaproteobacteria bacterium]|nr:saccharopine dehydrogenase NADP-binding domain-containing protein [Deltaproteobacteria bacterium]MBW2138740.1 saccharopine dehydrogenase NADP-binding domain-containing protein [Deltaproteobacteria bacterium]